MPSLKARTLLYACHGSRLKPYLMSINVNAQLEGLNDRHRHLFGQHIGHYIYTICLRLNL